MREVKAVDFPIIILISFDHCYKGEREEGKGYIGAGCTHMVGGTNSC